MFPLRLKLILSLTTLTLLVVGGAFVQSSRVEPALTRSPSVLPPPAEHLFYVGAAEAAPRSIPWNCDDWQASPAVADAADARVSMILESLAANRGKTIYCAIDQSDTFTKAETWAAGRHRNERDDTAYFGQSGNFRGFLSAQEGYLTNGESGVSGQSIDRIFEFPEEERRRRWKTIVTDEEFVPADTIRRVYTPFAPEGLGHNDQRTAEIQAENRFTNAQTAPDFDWNALLKAVATAHCKNAGYNRARNAIFIGSAEWNYSPDRDSGADFRFQARQYRLWSADCQKTKRVRR